jgi:hypothetical protein
LKKIISILYFLISFISVSNAQKELNNWMIGYKAGLSFNNGATIPQFNSAMTYDEGSSTISDKNGNLLFYTDGVTVWNRNHQVMQNGNSLAGYYESTQPALIVKQPGSETIYYIFTTQSLYYSIVDISLDGGLGAVTVKNVSMTNIIIGARVTAVKHCNQKDIWIIARSLGLAGLSQFVSFLLTNNGISTNPVISASSVSDIGVLGQSHSEG